MKLFRFFIGEKTIGYDYAPEGDTFVVCRRPSGLERWLRNHHLSRATWEIKQLREGVFCP
jgi:hypothetical protein